MDDSDHPVFFSPPSRPLDDPSNDRLRSALSVCPDVAFAHLVDVRVESVESQPQLSLFVWLVPAGLKSLRSSLNLVSEAVANAIPEDRYLDVLILNTAPEMLAAVESAGCLFVERDGDQRRQALKAAADTCGESAERSYSAGWFPL